MPPIIDRIREEQRLNDNRDIQLAERTYNWNRSFSNVPSAEVLRSQLNLTDAIERAENNALNLAAQRDIKALKLLQGREKFNEWRRQAPLREEKLLREVESEGAHQRFVEQKDAETMRDLAGFFETTRNIKSKVGTPEYAAELSSAVQAYPRIIGSQVSADALKRLQKEHEDIQSIQPREGFRISRYEATEDGGMKAIMEPIPVQQSVPSGLVPTGASQTADGKTTVTYGTEKSKEDQSLERQRKLYANELSKAKTRRQRAQQLANEDLIRDADEDIKNYTRDLEETESLIRSAREGAQAPQGASALNPNQAALDWLAANPNDPRAPAVRAKLGIQ